MLVRGSRLVELLQHLQGIHQDLSAKDRLGYMLHQLEWDVKRLRNNLADELMRAGRRIAEGQRDLEQGSSFSSSILYSSGQDVDRAAVALTSLEDKAATVFWLLCEADVRHWVEYQASEPVDSVRQGAENLREIARAAQWEANRPKNRRRR